MERYKEIIKIKNKILIILIILISLFLNVTVVLLPQTGYTIGILIPYLGLGITEVIRYFFLILSILVYIIYIYKFINLYKGIKETLKKSVSENRLDERFIKDYKKYSKNSLLELLFYSVMLIIYIFLLLIVLI